MGKACERGICDDGSCTCELTNRIAQLESELREAKAATESAEDALTIATERYDRELLTLEGSTVRLHWARAEDLLAKERDEHAKTKAALENLTMHSRAIASAADRMRKHEVSQDEMLQDARTALAVEQAAHRKTKAALTKLERFADLVRAWRGVYNERACLCPPNGDQKQCWYCEARELLGEPKVG